MKIDTTRFGEIDIKESEFIVMKGPIFGFQHRNRFILLIPRNNKPLWWLQSVDTPSLAFVVINPCVVKPGYNPEISVTDLEFLDIIDQEDIALLSIVTIRSHPFRVTANLRAPILINAETRMAQQIILDDASYPIQYDVIDYKANVSNSLSEAGRGVNEFRTSPLTRVCSVI